MDWMTVMLVFVSCYQLKTNAKVKSTRCRPREVVKTVGNVYEILEPRVTVVKECSGYDESTDPLRTHYKCVPTETAQHAVIVYNHHETNSVAWFTNHTKCEMKCVCKLNDYTCSDKDEFKGEVPCPEGTKWNKDNCKCEAACAETVTTRKGTKKDEPPQDYIGILIASLIGEFIVIVIVFYSIHFCISHHSKLSNSSSSGDESKNVGPEKIISNESRCPTGSVSITIEDKLLVNGKHW